MCEYIRQVYDGVDEKNKGSLLFPHLGFRWIAMMAEISNISKLSLRFCGKIERKKKSHV